MAVCVWCTETIVVPEFQSNDDRYSVVELPEINGSVLLHEICFIDILSDCDYAIDKLTINPNKDRQNLIDYICTIIDQDYDNWEDYSCNYVSGKD